MYSTLFPGKFPCPKFEKGDSVSSHLRWR